VVVRLELGQSGAATKKRVLSRRAIVDVHSTHTHLCAKADGTTNGSIAEFTEFAAANTDVVKSHSFVRDNFHISFQTNYSVYILQQVFNKTTHLSLIGEVKSTSSNLQADAVEGFLRPKKDGFGHVASCVEITSMYSPVLSRWIPLLISITVDFSQAQMKGFYSALSQFVSEKFHKNIGHSDNFLRTCTRVHMQKSTTRVARNGSIIPMEMKTSFLADCAQLMCFKVSRHRKLM